MQDFSVPFLHCLVLPSQQPLQSACHFGEEQVEFQSQWSALDHTVPPSGYRMTLRDQRL